jgi:hypothetical protein
MGLSSMKLVNTNIDVKIKWLTNALGVQLTEASSSAGERMHNSKRDSLGPVQIFTNRYVWPSSSTLVSDKHA